MAVADSKRKDTQDPEAQSAVFSLLDELLAMDAALADVCDKTDIEVALVIKYTLCDDEAKINEACDPALAEGYIGLFMGIIE
jgi:hypothetical protein